MVLKKEGIPPEGATREILIFTKDYNHLRTVGP